MSDVSTPLSERAAAARIGISIHTLRKWRKAGKGPAYFAVSRVIRYSAAALDAFIASATTGGAHAS